MEQNQGKSISILSLAPSPLIPPITKGQKHTYGLLRALGNLANVVCITNVKSEMEGHSFELRPLFQRKIRKFIAFSNYKLILRIISRIKPRAILLEQPYYGIVVRWISKQTQVPYSIHAHQVEFLKHKALGNWWWPVVYWLEHIAFKSAENIFFISGNDRNLAIRKFRLNPDKCFISPYGVPQNEPVIASNEKVNLIKRRHDIQAQEKVFLFFGDLKYLQNVEAVENIIQEINPRLEKIMVGQPYKILICGGGASKLFADQLNQMRHKNIIYTGYVSDVAEYLQTADVVMNPIKHRGGIKIKVIEALGYNKPVVSTEKGALGIDKNVCGSMLAVVRNNDWESFTKHMHQMVSITDVIPQQFFDIYHWDAIAKSVLDKMTRF